MSIVDPPLQLGADVLGDEVLGEPDGPSYEACLTLLRPVEGCTFLATGTCPEIFAVDPQGRIGFLSSEWGKKELERVLFDPRDYLPPHTPTAHTVHGSHRSLHHCFFEPVTGFSWDQDAEIFPGAKAGTAQVYVYLGAGPFGTVSKRMSFRVTAEGVERDVFGDYLRDHSAREREPTFAKAKALDYMTPEPWLTKACHLSLWRAFATYEGDHPHYGVGHYRASMHDGFPPTTLSMVNACVEWSLMDRARRYLDYYLDHFLRPDGTFDYYGPAVSEYGQMLDAIARTARRGGGAGWLRGRLPEIERIVGYLLRLRREGQERFPKGDLRHGLVFGSPEADTWNEVNFYFAGDAWTWRGWTEIARAFIALGDEPMKQRGRELLAECDAYRPDIEASLAKSVVPGPIPFVPPVAGFDKPFASMTQDRFASYTNYRYWPEMLSAGFLRPEWADAIIDYRQSHGGEVLGTSRFYDHLDDWPYAGYGQGLLLRGRGQDFQLGFYGHLAGHCTPGTFISYEQVSITGNPRTPVADYCVPAQLVTPLLAKWMLVFEEPDADVLWLCRANPSRWLSPGRSIIVRRARTRWGSIDFEIRRERWTLEATIWLPRAGFPAEIRLELRFPQDSTIRSATINGKPCTDLDGTSQTLRIVRPQDSVLHIAAKL